MKATFSTSDLYLASALQISGFRLVDLKKSPSGRGVFFFEDKPNRPEMVRNFFSGELIGSLKAFCNSWSDLKNLLGQMDMEKPHARSTQ